MLAPFIAFFIAERYQSRESVRSTTETHVRRVADQISALIDMAKDFQLASDSLATNCSKDAQAAKNLCLAEYVGRINRMNELVADLSWKTGLLPASEDVNDVQRKWQTLWWQQTSGGLKKLLTAMANDGRLLECQALDFPSSACGSAVNQALEPFRDETTTLMCAFSVTLHGHLAGLYALLPRGAERNALLSAVDWQRTKSFCAQRAGDHPTN
ncbi:MAG TPA: hypothetical protein VHO06_14140 [Polyangia bacterium]|nr:hypothetical protein [Polyangia bacterium]